MLKLSAKFDNVYTVEHCTVTRCGGKSVISTTNQTETSNIPVAVQAKVQPGGEDQDHRQQLHGGGRPDSRG